MDKNIYQIQILDGNKRTLTEVVDVKLRGKPHRIFEAPIHKTTLDVAMFDSGSEPHIGTDDRATAHPARPEPLGYIKVALSPSLMLEKKREQIMVGSLIATVALIVSMILGLYLAMSLTKPLSATIDALRRVRGGNRDITLDVTTGGEIGELQASIVEMNSNLKQFTENLESKVAARTKDLEEARNQAIKAHAENRRLIQKVHSAVEEERENIAVEIHDHLNASLIVAKLAAQNIVDMIKRDPSALKAEEIRARAQSIIDLTADLYQSARGLVKRLRPEIIDTLGLLGAVEEMVRHYDEIHPDCHFALSVDGDFSDLPSALAISAYRLIQEALSNVVKHADATHATVRLKKQQETLLIEVRDNGKGFDKVSIEPGIGLIGMRERAYRWGGTLDVVSETGVGTTVRASLDLNK